MYRRGRQRQKWSPDHARLLQPNRAFPYVPNNQADTKRGLAQFFPSQFLLPSPPCTSFFYAFSTLFALLALSYIFSIRQYFISVLFLQPLEPLYYCHPVPIVGIIISIQLAPETALKLALSQIHNHI